MTKTWISYQRATRLTQNWRLAKQGKLVPVRVNAQWVNLGYIQGMGYYLQPAS